MGLRPRVVALDLDGTLIHRPGSFTWEAGDGERPTARVTEAIRRLADRGVLVVLATGRMYPGTAPVHDHLELESPLICQQGCAVHAPDGTEMHVVQLDGGVALEIAAYARELGHAFEWFTPWRYIVSGQTEDSDAYALLSGVPVEHQESPETSGVPPTGVGIISSAAEAPEIHRHLVRRFGDAVQVLDFPTVTVCVAAEANKGHALEMICADYGIDRREAIAIGDSVNDASMLAWAGRGYALSHGDRYALDAADEVLDSSESDPVAELLETLGG